MAIYMNWDGVPGDVTTQGYEKWIELTSFQWGVGRGIGSAMSGQASRESSIPSVSEIVVTKRMDFVIARAVDRLGSGRAQHDGEDRVHHNQQGRDSRLPLL